MSSAGQQALQRLCAEAWADHESVTYKNRNLIPEGEQFAIVIAADLGRVALVDMEGRVRVRLHIEAREIEPRASTIRGVIRRIEERSPEAAAFVRANPDNRTG